MSDAGRGEFTSSRHDGPSTLGQPRLGDAFGALLAAGLERDGRAGEVFEVVERDDGHVRANDVARYFRPSWGRLDDWMYDHTRGRVLDVGCGAGRSAIALVDGGHEVVGVDVSPGAVAVCRRRGFDAVVEGTVYDAHIEGRFDTIVLAGNNVGLLGNRNAAGGFLDRLAQLSAGPAARIVGTAIGHEPGAMMAAEDREYEASNLSRGRLRWQVTMRSRYATLATDWFDYLFLTPSELTDLVSDSPWKIADLVEDGPSYAVRLDLVA